MLDIPETDKLLLWLEEQVDVAEKDVHAIAGRPVNLAAPGQVAWLLYDRLKLPVLKLTAGKGQPSTNKEALATLEARTKHPVFDIIRRHRSYTKGHGIIWGYKRLADSNYIIHPNIKTDFARTGREACDTPNLQNVSKSRATEKVKFPVPARNCFRPRPEHAMLIIDESGIEIRIIAERANCEGLKRMIRTGVHPHVFWCQKMYGDRFVSKSASPDLYDPGKNSHFAKWYGGGDAQCADTANLHLAEFRAGLNAYARTCPEVKKFASEGAKRMETEGFVTTPFGRDLWIPKEELYAWFNFDVQGTAAGVIKRGQVQSRKVIRNGWSTGVHQILTVHDDIMFEIHRHTLKYLPDLYKEIDTAMTEISHIDVPLEVEASLGVQSWGTAKELVL
jgi:DNA polymerase-1